MLKLLQFDLFWRFHEAILHTANSKSCPIHCKAKRVLNFTSKFDEANVTNLHTGLDLQANRLRYPRINFFSLSLADRKKKYVFFSKPFSYLVGSSKNRKDGSSNNSSPIDSRLRSPPDKQEMRVFLLLDNPSVFTIDSICHQERIQFYKTPG